MAANNRPLVIAFMADVAAAVGQITGLTSAVNGLNGAAGAAAGGLGDVGGAGAAGLAAAEKALRQLGVKSEAVADAQIATLENAFRDLQNSGTASADEIARAQAAMEARIRQINDSIGRDTRTTWQRIGDNVKKQMGNIQGYARTGLKAGAAGVVAAGSVGLAAGGATFLAVQAEAERQDELIKMARSTNTNLETLSAYAFAAEQSAVDLSTLGKAFQKLRVQMQKAEEPGKPIDTTGMDAEEIAEAQAMDGSVLKRMGIATRTASGDVRKFDDVLRDVIGKLMEIEDAGARATVAAEIFGNKMGPQMASFIEIGVEGLDQAVETAQRFGLVVTEATALQAEAFNDRFDDLSQRMTGLRADLTAPLFAPFTEIFIKLGALLDQNREKIVALGTVFADNVLSVFYDFMSIFEGYRGEVVNTWVLTLVDTITGMGTVFTDIIIPALTTVVGLLANTDTTILAIGAGMYLLATIALPIIAIVAAIGAIPAAIIAAIVAVGIAIYTWWDEIRSWLPWWLGGSDEPSMPESVDAQQADLMKNAADLATPAPAGTPVNLNIENKTYALSAPADVAKALTEDQNAKTMLQPTNLSRAQR